MTFCYWTVATGEEHAFMAQTMIASARRVGVTEDFHVYSDRDVPGAITHLVEPFDLYHYIFKFDILKTEVSKLDHDYMVFLDADNFFVRHPGDFSPLLRDNKWWAQMENEVTSPLVIRGDWWRCQIHLFPLLMRHLGIHSERIWNTNAGMFIVRRDAIEEFYNQAMFFYNTCRNQFRLVDFTEEPALAFVGHFVDDPVKNTLGMTCSTWACDWTGNYKDRLPDGNAWKFEDYLSGFHRTVNPAIVHAMKSKSAMIKAAKMMNEADKVNQ